MKKSLFAAALVAGLNMSAVANVHQFSTCHLNEGKTSADAYALLEQGEEWNRAQEGMPQASTVEIMWPFYGGERQPGTFVLHYVAEDFGEFGGALKMLWDDGLSQESPMLTNNAVWHCTQNQVLWAPQP